MEIKSKFDHFNINVTNLERSIAFYEQALGLKEHHRKESSDGSFTLVYLTDGSTGFLLELTCLKEHPQATNWARTKAISASAWPETMMQSANITRKTAGYVLKIPSWDSISLTTPMITGLRYCPPSKLYGILCNKRITINYLIHQQREYRRSNDGRYCFQRQEREA